MLFVAKQREMRMRHTVIGGLAGYATFLYSTLSHKRRYFRKKKRSKWTYNVCFDFLYTFVSNISHVWEELSEIW
jgi:hypothetical protein